MNNTALILIGGSIALFFYMQSQRKEQERREWEELQRQKAYSDPGTSNWLRWVQLGLQLYGTAKALWEPGGPFYKSNVPQPGTKEWFEMLSKINYIP